MLFRYGVMRTLGVMSAREDLVFNRGTASYRAHRSRVETGIILCEATPAALAQLPNPTQGQVLRAMSAQDSAELSRILLSSAMNFIKCKKYVADSKLDLQLVDVERIFGGERIVVINLSEKSDRLS